MSTALYRRYRPETFADVIGQEHVTEPLMQALRSGRVNHAYLFSGPRGCGKTTSARILARCLNCDQGPTPEPCGTCDSCVALARGGPGLVDVVEIDAASHGGVDDARDLRERAAFGPAQARYKVYIIDEAHMVTPHGFNALLKVVEEPPEHVKFIFATTEPDKVLSTIRSRTHHYPFHLVPPQRLTAYLEQLCASEGVDLEPGVLSFVTRAGGGSVRDSLSVLDQLIAGAGDDGLTYERTAALLGFTDVELLDAVIDAVGAGDAASVFTQVDKVMESGHDPRRFVEDLLERYRDLIVLTAVGDRSGGLLRGLPDDQVERMQQQAVRYSPETLTRAADIVSRGLSEMTGAVSYRMHLELICARLLLPGASGEAGYAARLDRIERRLSAGGTPPAGTLPAGTARAGSEPQRPGPAQQTRSSQEPEPQRAEPQPPEQPTSQSSARPEAHHPGRQRPESYDADRQGDPAGAPDAEPPSSDRSAPPEPGSETAQQAPTRQESTQQEPARPGAAQHEPAQAAGALDTDALRRNWPQVLDAVKKIRRVTWTFVSGATVVEFDGQRLVLGIGTAGQTNTFRQGNHAEVVSRALQDALGLDARVEGVPLEGGDQPPPGGGSGGGPGGAVSGGSAGGFSPPDAGPGPDLAGPSAHGPSGAAPEPRASMAEQLGVAGASRARSGRDDGGWAQQSAQAATAPAWAQPANPVPAESPERPEPPVDAPDREGHPGHGTAGGDGAAVERPVGERDGESPDTSAARPGRPSLRVIPGGDLPSADDEDLESSGLVGQTVVESVLGGTVISIDEDATS